jgi:Mn-dependent DtxR family transcriptional regulator
MQLLDMVKQVVEGLRKQAKVDLSIEGLDPESVNKLAAKLHKLGLKTYISSGKITVGKK